MPRSLMAWLSGLIVSRGISQVSEMILATVSNVEGISKSLIGQAFRQPRWHGSIRLGAPRSGPSPPRMVGCPYSEETPQVQWRRLRQKSSTVEHIRPALAVLSKAPDVT